MKQYLSSCSLMLFAVCGLSGCSEPDETNTALSFFERRAHASVANNAPASKAKFNPRLLRRFKSARTEIDGAVLSEPRINLGRQLYFETRISRGHDLSCNSCHLLDAYGDDGHAFSSGHKGALGGRNAPTVYHAAAAFEQFWDGRAADVEAQALGPIMNPVEMAAPSERYVLDVLESMPEYVAAFKSAFPEESKPVTFKNVGRAIGAFERRLTTRGRWDAFLEGDHEALNAKEVEGLKLFTNLGCMVCHTGELVGGSMFEKVGVVEPWPNQKDQGRYEVTHKDGDRMLFKVPTLRNVGETAPYFHDGSASALPQAVRMMAKHQLGLDLEQAEVDSIVAWLNSLTGNLPQDYIKPPELPRSTASTPKPDRT